ncbi:MAG: Ig-like domain-containing protein [Myxococcota bacterium]
MFQSTAVPRWVTLCALLGAPLLIQAVAARPAMAQGAGVFAAPTVALLPGTPAVGDGATPITLHLLALDEAGAPLDGVTGRLRAARGEAGRVEQLAPGLLAVTWTPPAIQAPTDLTLTFQGRTVDRQSLELEIPVSLTPPIAQRIAVTASPPQVVLGQDASVNLSITIPRVAGRAIQERDLVVRASAGAVSNVTALGDGAFSAMYTPPNKPFPHLAVITVVDRRAPDLVFGTFALPLVGKAEFPVTAAPNSRVILTIGDRDFGPIQADETGRARVPIVVPPGVFQGTLVSITNAQKTEEVIDLKLPDTRRVELLPTFNDVPADPTLTVPIRVFVAQEDGQPDTTATVSFSATAGRVSGVTNEGGGIYRADFAPPYGNARSQATVQASVDDTRGDETASINVSLVPSRPQSVSIQAEPPELLPQAKALSAFVKVTGPDETGVSGRQIRIFANGARRSGDIADLGDGDYQVRLATTGDGGAEVTAMALDEAGDNPLSTILLIPSRDRLRNDGVASTALTVLTLDRLGYPVADVTVSLKALRGGGSLPSSITTDSRGIAQVNYTSGRVAGVAQIQASVDDRVGVIGVLQLPAGADGVETLPPSERADVAALRSAWRAAIATVRVDRQGAGGVISASDVSGQPGPLARLTLDAEPTVIAPGGTITLTIRAEDDEGRGKSGISLGLTASVGQIGAVTDLGGGSYEAALVMAPDAAGTASVTATGPNAVRTALEVPISAPTAASWGQAQADAPPDAPVVPPKAPREPGDWPWMRVEAGGLYARYSYNQEPDVATGPLYNQSITFGGGTSDPANAAGLNLRARAFLPALPYLGGDIAYRGSQYAVEIPGFEDAIVDWLHDFHLMAIGRAPFVFGQNRVSIGGRAGLQLDDFIVYRQEVQDDQRFLAFEPLFVGALQLGADIEAEIGERFFAVGTVDLGLANSWIFYRTDLAMTLGVAVTKDWYLHGGVSSAARNTTLYNDDDQQIGELADGATQFSVGLGYQRR